MDSLFNTSKSNKHLWEQISHKMRERGFDRSPTMCTDKWRNLLKEYKKAKHQERGGGGGGGSAKMSSYKDLEELLRERDKTAPYKTPTSAASRPNVDAYINFSPKGEEPPETLFMKELKGRGMTPASLLEDNDRSPYGLGNKEIKTRERAVNFSKTKMTEELLQGLMIGANSTRGHVQWL